MRKLVMLIGLTGLLAFALGSAARAIPPEHFPVIHVDDTFTLPVSENPCGFSIDVHVVGDVRHTEFFDAEGNVIRALTVFPRFRVTFSANGKSITTVSIAVEHARINPDGSFTVAVTGLQGHLIVGGGPPLGAMAAPVGRHHVNRGCRLTPTSTGGSIKAAILWAFVRSVRQSPAFHSTAGATRVRQRHYDVERSRTIPTRIEFRLVVEAAVPNGH